MCPVVDGSAITSGFEPMDAGTYEAVLSSYELKTGPKGQYYALEFTITDAPYENRKAWRNVSITPQSLWAFKSACMALGADESEFEGTFDTDDVIEPLLNNSCRLEIGQEEFNDRIQNPVKKISGLSV